MNFAAKIPYQVQSNKYSERATVSFCVWILKAVYILPIYMLNIDWQAY